MSAQFDTHRYIKHLTDNGFTENQAEALVDGQAKYLASDIATKADLADLRNELKTDLKDLEIRLIKYGIGLTGAAVAVTGILLKLLLP